MFPANNDVQRFILSGAPDETLYGKLPPAQGTRGKKSMGRIQRLRNQGRRDRRPRTRHTAGGRRKS